MQNGPKDNKKRSAGWLWLLVALAVILAAALLLPEHSEPTATNPTAPGVHASQPVNSETAQNRPDEVPDASEQLEQTEQTEQTHTTVPAQSDGSDVPTDPAVTTDPTDPTEQLQQPSAGETEPQATQPSVEIIQQAEAEYEKWLGASLLICVSMEYPDFELEGIYAASATDMEDKLSSDGAYIVFTSGGTRMAIHSVALEAERTEPGTCDISTEAIGYATFDRVDPASIDVEAMEPLALEELSELISQSLLVSIYSR